jgi:hypothetical protein
MTAAVSIGGVIAPDSDLARKAAALAEHVWLLAVRDVGEGATAWSAKSQMMVVISRE